MSCRYYYEYLLIGTNVFATIGRSRSVFVYPHRGQIPIIIIIKKHLQHATDVINFVYKYNILGFFKSR